LWFLLLTCPEAAACPCRPFPFVLIVTQKSYAKVTAPEKGKKLSDCTKTAPPLCAVSRFVLSTVGIPRKIPYNGMEDSSASGRHPAKTQIGEEIL
jgi:hypothetical protein